jgi:hypothetical protein
VSCRRIPGPSERPLEVGEGLCRYLGALILGSRGIRASAPSLACHLVPPTAEVVVEKAVLFLEIIG